METLEKKLEEIINQLGNKNTDFSLNLKTALDDLSLSTHSVKIKTHIKSLSQKCLEEPEKARNIFKYYLYLLNSVPRMSSSNMPPENSKCLSITNLKTNSNHIFRLFPGQEVKKLINQVKIFIKLEKAEPSNQRSQNFKILLKESNRYTSRVLVSCNGNTITPNQFYMVENSLLRIRSTSDSEVKADFFADFLRQLQDYGYQKFRSNEFIFKENFRYNVLNHQINVIRPMFQGGFMITKVGSEWKIGYQTNNVYLFLGNPLENGFCSDYFEISLRNSEFFIDSTTFKVEIIAES